MKSFILACHLFMHQDDLSKGRYLISLMARAEGDAADRHSCRGLFFFLLLFCSFSLLTRFFGYHRAVITRHSGLDETRCDLRRDRCNYTGVAIMLARTVPTLRQSSRTLTLSCVLVVIFCCTMHQRHEATTSQIISVRLYAMQKSTESKQHCSSTISAGCVNIESN